MPPDLVPYVILLRAVIEGRLSAKEFADVYVVLFKQDPLIRPREIYDVLSEIFGAAECHREDADPGDPFQVSDDELMESAVHGLGCLEELV